MSYENPHALGNIALGCGGCYNMGSHGCASATYESVANADLPSYAHGFYSQTEHEALSDIKYSRTDIGYDRNLREMKRALDGAPIEAYIPRSFAVDDSGSAVPKTGAIEPIVIKNPNQKIVDEILKAQKEVTGEKEIVLRHIEIEEIVIKRRRIRKREIRIKKKDEVEEER